MCSLPESRALTIHDLIRFTGEPSLGDVGRFLQHGGNGFLEASEKAKRLSLPLEMSAGEPWAALWLGNFLFRRSSTAALGDGASREVSPLLLPHGKAWA